MREAKHLCWWPPVCGRDADGKVVVWAEYPGGTGLRSAVIRRSDRGGYVGSVSGDWKGRIYTTRLHADLNVIKARLECFARSDWEKD